MVRSNGRFGCLGERNFRLFFTAYATSIVGSAMVPVALTFAVLNGHHHVSAVSYVLAAETVPLVLFLMLGGVIADRISRPVVMVGADVLRCLSECVLAVLLFTGSPPVWAIAILAAVLGAGQAFFNPAMTGLMPEIVAPTGLQQANALRATASASGQVVGPAVAGIIVAVGGAGWAIAIDAATYAVSAACLLGLEIPARPAAAGASMLGELVEGWNAFRSRTWLWAIVAQFAAFNALCFAPFMVLGAVVARDRLGGAAAWGIILAGFGAGSVIGALLSTRVHPHRPLVVATFGAAAFAIPVALVAIPAPTALIALGAGLAGLGLSIFGTLWETSLQQHVPGELLSRVSAYDWFGSVAFVPIGYVITAPLASILGLRAALFFAATWAVASCVAVLLTPSVRNLTAPGASQPAAGRPGPE
jgi:MFS family permease